jgi:hypothetical protein
VYGNYNEAWARGCIDHNKKALALITNTESISHVVLSAAFSQYLSATQERFLVGSRIVDQDPSIGKHHLVNTIEEIKRAGKIPILVSPPPYNDFNIGECLERQELGLPLFRRDCDIDLSKYEHDQKSTNELLGEVAYQTGTEIVWLKDLFCGERKCQTRFNNTHLYRDKVHLTIEGSEAILRDLLLVNES